MDMFAKEPQAAVIKRVAAFMYGNYVTVSDAVVPEFGKAYNYTVHSAIG